MQIIAVTMGDAAGIGPEISVKAVLSDEVRKVCRPFIIGSGDVIKAAVDRLRDRGVDCFAAVYHDFEEIVFSEGVETGRKEIIVLDVWPLEKENFGKGSVCPECGKAAVKYMDEAVRLCEAGSIGGFASAPMNKEGMALAGYDFAGATEYLAFATCAKEFAMIMFFGPIKMFYATNHVSLRGALDLIDEKLIYDKLVFIDRTLREMGEMNKLIGIASVNPHAGEGGKLGMEEIEIQAPAIKRAVSAGCEIEGPLPADSLFYIAKDGKYGAVLVMYHDQGNIAAKLLNFGSGVTYIHGLPVIRTSVAHGTAYDIAGQGIATESTLVQAILKAAEIAGRRRLIWLRQ